jgi:hypothetical protein
MANPPTCPLCQARLVKKENVCTGVRELHPLAWICPDCSAAFPMAIKISALARWFSAGYGRAEPLFYNQIDGAASSESSGDLSDDRIQRLERPDGR